MAFCNTNESVNRYIYQPSEARDTDYLNFRKTFEMLLKAILLTLASFVVVTILGILLAKSKKHNSQNPVVIPILFATWIILLCAGMFAFYKANQIVFYIIIFVTAFLVIRNIRSRASFRKINLLLNIFELTRETKPELSEHEQVKLTVEVYWRLKKFGNLYIIKKHYYLTHRAYPPEPLTIESVIFSLFYSRTLHVELQENPRMDVFARTIETLSEIRSYKDNYLSRPIFWKRLNRLETSRIRKKITEILGCDHNQDSTLTALVQAYQKLGEEIFDSIFRLYPTSTEDHSIPINLTYVWLDLHDNFVDDISRHIGFYTEKLKSFKMGSDEFVLTYVRNILRNNLASGRYHFYRGSLSTEGRGMYYLYRNVLTLALNQGIITQEELNEELRQTEDDIKFLG